MDYDRFEYYLHLNLIEKNILEIKFPFPLNISEGKWEVGLLEFSMSQDYYNVGKDGDFIQIFKDGTLVSSATVPSGKYMKLNDYNKHIQKAFTKSMRDNWLSLTTKGNSCSFLYRVNGMTVKFSERAADRFMLSKNEKEEGLSVDQFDENTEEEVVNIEFDPHANQRRFFLTTPVIAPQFALNKTLRVLGSVPANDYDPQGKIDFSNSSPFYLRIEGQSSMERFQLAIVDEKGREVEGIRQHCYALVHLKKK